MVVLLSAITGLLVLSGLFLTLKKAMYDPFANGTRRVDPAKYPSLERYQRILIASNVSAREKESAKRLRTIRVKKEQGLQVIEKSHRELLQINRDHHRELVQFWDGLYNELCYPAIRAERERKALNATPNVEEAKVSNPPKGYAVEGRRVGSVAVRIRNAPTTDGSITSVYAPDAILWVDGYTHGENFNSNDIWFRKSYRQGYSKEWAWSGAFSVTSVAGLPLVKNR